MPTVVATLFRHVTVVLTPANLTEGSHCSSGVLGRSPPFGVGASSLGPVGPGPVGPPFPRSGSFAHGSPPCWWADVVNIILETQVSLTPPAPSSRPQPPSAVRMAITITAFARVQGDGMRIPEGPPSGSDTEVLGRGGVLWARRMVGVFWAIGWPGTAVPTVVATFSGPTSVVTAPESFVPGGGRGFR